MSTGEESFVPVEEAEVKSAMPNEELDTPTKASSMKEGAEDSTPSGKRFPLPDQAKSSQATYVFKPDKPKMGGLVRTGREDWTPWVGGKPKIDWSELADSKDLYIDPRQFRPTSAGSAQKSKSYRMVAVEPNLSKRVVKPSPVVNGNSSARKFLTMKSMMTTISAVMIKWQAA